MVLSGSSRPNSSDSNSTPFSASDSTSPGSETPSLSRWPITRPNGRPPLYIDLVNLPQPWLRWRTDRQARVIGKHVQQTSDHAVQDVGRPLKQEEADAVAFHLAKAVSSVINGVPASLAVVMALTWRGRHTFRFPFYTPKWTSRSPDRFFFLRGRTARAHWHTLRGGAYMFTGGLLTMTSFGFYGVSLGVVGRIQDPRLKEFNDLVAQNVHVWTPNMRDRQRDAGSRARKNHTAERSGDESPEVAKQSLWAQSKGDESDDNVTGDGLARNMDGMLPTTDHYQDQAQETDKRALLEAIRRADGKSVEGSPDSPPSGSAWHRLRQEARLQGSEASQLSQEAMEKPTSTMPGTAGHRHGEDTDA